MDWFMFVMIGLPLGIGIWGVVVFFGAMAYRELLDAYKDNS
jgi:hypothetical protein